MSYFLIPPVILGIDQLTKSLVNKNLKNGERIPLVENKLYITNIKNKGAAMGLMEDNQKLLGIFNSAAVFAQIIVFFRMVTETDDKISKIAAAFMVGGGIANAFDRMRKKQVTDFIEVKKPSLPVFNLADIFIMLGAITMLINIFTREK